MTHPEVTRFFMTVTEAVHLVLQAAADGPGGRTLILNMGDPVNITSIAHQLIRASGRDIEVQFVGLRAGEKLHETLTADNEFVEDSLHPLVTQVSVKPLSLSATNITAVEPEEFTGALERLALE